MIREVTFTFDGL